MTPTQRTLKRLRDAGYLAAVVMCERNAMRWRQAFAEVRAAK